jgi:hypothetical protein
MKQPFGFEDSTHPS